MAQEGCSRMENSIGPADKFLRGSNVSSDAVVQARTRRLQHRLRSHGEAADRPGLQARWAMKSSRQAVGLVTLAVLLIALEAAAVWTAVLHVDEFLAGRGGGLLARTVERAADRALEQA